VELPEPRRAAFLDEACGGDSDLRRDVESLLAQEQSAQSFMEEPAVKAAAKTLIQTRPETWVGRHISHYEILAVLVAGGMGEVYRSRDTKLKREVAIKILPAEWSQDSDRVHRFKREAELLANLNHPRIAHIYGFEESGETACLVLELVEGETLAYELKRGPV